MEIKVFVISLGVVVALFPLAFVIYLRIKYKRAKQHVIRRIEAIDLANGVDLFFVYFVQLDLWWFEDLKFYRPVFLFKVLVPGRMPVTYMLFFHKNKPKIDVQLS